MADSIFPSGEETSSVPVFNTISNPSGAEVYDPIEKVRFELHTPEPVSIHPASTDEFPFPMDSAVRFSTTRIRLPKRVEVNFWSGKNIVEHFSPDGVLSRYLIENTI
ncbi:hypothetical protein ACFFQF_02915 [Haladaptatus pallidirubidus]|uniref:hypothetical protein n=1 Tax=Haladaptatus pallidirubidus TaxID=1008152 RepID=UPI0035E929AC